MKGFGEKNKYKACRGDDRELHARSEAGSNNSDVRPASRAVRAV